MNTTDQITWSREFEPRLNEARSSQKDILLDFTAAPM
jgi:hypothetical protein